MRGKEGLGGLAWLIATWVLALVRAAAADPGPGLTLVIITPHPEEIRREFATAFDAWHRGRFGDGVRMEWRDVGGSGEAQRFVMSEFASKPGGIGIDVFFGGGPEPFLALAEKGWLERHVPPREVGDGLGREVNGLEIHDAGGRWHGACLSSFGILRNTRVEAWAGLPAPRRWEDLADPRLLGWVGAGDPRLSGTMNNMYEAYLQAFGWERGWGLLARVAGNVRQFDRLSSTTAKEAMLGQVSCAFCIDYYAFVQMAAAGGTNMAFVLPEDFVSVSPDGIAVLRGSPHPEVAARFMDFVLGEEGQRLWMLPAGHPLGPRRDTLLRLPVRPGLYERFAAESPIRVRPFEIRAGFRYDARLANGRREIVRSMFGAMYVDVHEDLVRAWRRIVELGLPEEAVRELGRVPLREDEALALAKGPWTSPTERNRLKTRWQQEARDRYRRLSRMPGNKAGR